MYNEFLLHIPHASVRIPDGCRTQFLTDPEDEFPFMTDWYTDELFDLPARKLIFPVSRLVCDPERFRDDSLEEMSLRGMGACYTKTHDGTPLRELSAVQREQILRRWYDPHHEALTRAVGDILKRFGRCTVLDCHSFSPVPLPYEPDQEPDRPDICIGTDTFHTPPRLTGQLFDAFCSLGYRVGINTPYAGTMVPLRYYRADPQVRSVMIEVNRGLYLTEDCRKSSAFPALAKDIRRVFEIISDNAEP